MSVSVVVPTAGAGDEAGPYVDRCLAGVLAADPGAELLVMVNREHQALGDRLRADHGAKLGWTTGPFNYSAAINRGVEHAGHEAVLVLNDDVEPLPQHPDWLAVLLEDLDRGGVGVVGATLFHEDGTVQHAGMAFEESGWPYHLRYGETGYRPETRPAQAVTGACFATTRTAHQVVGGLDEEYPLCFSDVDYCLRAREHRYSVWVSAAVLLHHEWGTRGNAGIVDARGQERWSWRWASRS